MGKGITIEQGKTGSEICKKTKEIPSGTVAYLKGDKSLLDAYFRSIFVGHTVEHGHNHESRSVYLMKNEIIMEEDDFGNSIFFVLVIPTNNKIKNEAQVVPVPLFMLRLSGSQKSDIMNWAVNLGFVISLMHFFKPKVSLTYDDRIDLVPGYLDELENEQDLIEIFGQKEIDGYNPSGIPIPDWIKKHRRLTKL
jgi:hypothetical protein